MISKLLVSAVLLQCITVQVGIACIRSGTSNNMHFWYVLSVPWSNMYNLRPRLHVQLQDVSAKMYMEPIRDTSYITNYVNLDNICVRYIWISQCKFWDGKKNLYPIFRSVRYINAFLANWALKVIGEGVIDSQQTLTNGIVWVMWRSGNWPNECQLVWGSLQTLAN